MNGEHWLLLLPSMVSSLLMRAKHTSMTWMKYESAQPWNSMPRIVLVYMMPACFLMCLLCQHSQYGSQNRRWWLPWLLEISTFLPWHCYDKKKHWVLALMHMHFFVTSSTQQLTWVMTRWGRLLFATVKCTVRSFPPWGPRAGGPGASVTSCQYRYK